MRSFVPARRAHSRSARRACRNPRRVGRWLSLVVALLGPGPLAFADEPTPASQPPAKPVDERIEVIGRSENPYSTEEPSISRFLGSLKDTPQAITVVPQRLIEEQAATTLRDALRNVSGIGISAGEGGAQGDDFTLRGYSAKSDLFIDGVRDQGSYFRDSFNLEAIEVAKGPSATYFGRGSTGGAINQVSKAPRTDPGYSALLSAGNGPFLRATADLNQPLGDTQALRLNLMFQDAEVVDRDDVESNRRGLAASYAAGLGTETRLTFSYLFQEEDNIPDYGLPYIGGEPARVDRDTFYGLEDEDIEETRVNVLTARLEHEVSDQLSVRNTMRYSHVDRAAAPTAPRECLAGNAQCAGSTADGIRRGRPERDARETILSNQVDVNAAFDLGGFEHRAVTGVELSRETFSLTRFTNNGPFSVGLDPDAIDPNVLRSARVRSARQNTTALGFGIYAADEIALTDAVKVVGGVRYDVFSTRFSDDFPTGANTTGPDFDRRDRMLSWRGGLLWQPTPEQSWYVSYGTSFNPSAEALALSQANQGTDPEKNRSLELGSKVDLFDGALRLEGAVFQIDKTDARETDSVSGLQVLDGKRRVRGFELGAAGRVREGWNIFAGYTFLDGEVSETLDRLSEGNEPQRTPRHSATLWTTLALSERLQLGGGPTYVSHRFSNTQNTNRVDGYLRWDATLAYALSETVELRLNVQNLGDAEFFESAGGGHAIPAPGRAFVLSTRFTF
jgi:catecholate siderophore receptor